MNTFKYFYEATTGEPLGLIETIIFEELGPVKGKVDTGNGAYNVLHGINISPLGMNKVSFQTIKNKKLTKDIVETVDINIGSGVIETRPVVLFDIQIGNEKFANEKFSLANRADNQFKILIGKMFIKKLGGLVDVTKKNHWGT